MVPNKIYHEQKLAVFTQIIRTFYKEQILIHNMQRQEDQKISRKVEKMMEDIDAEKVKTSKFTVDEFLEFVDKTVSE